jgi:hypothetical protein
MPPQKTPWYRSATAISASGLLGLALIAVLVYAVVTMSSKWSTEETETVLPPGTHLPEPPHVAGKTSGSRTPSSYPSAQLSTTDIGLPGESTTTGTSSSESSSTESPSQVPPSEQTAPTFPGTFPTRVTNPPGPHTTRAGPRINETRTASP